MTRSKPLPSSPAIGTALGDILARQGLTTSATESPGAASVAPAPQSSVIATLPRSSKIVLRREKKGRGGKTVTIVSGLRLPAPGLEAMARALRQGLGCGARVEAEAIVLQGDMTERALRWLRAFGATRIIVAN